MSLEEITAAELRPGDAVKFTESPDAVYLVAVDVRPGTEWVVVRWAGQGEPCWLPIRRILFRLAKVCCSRVGLHNCEGVWANHDRALSSPADLGLEES